MVHAACRRQTSLTAPSCSFHRESRSSPKVSQRIPSLSVCQRPCIPAPLPPWAPPCQSALRFARTLSRSQVLSAALSCACVCACACMRSRLCACDHACVHARGHLRWLRALGVMPVGKAHWAQRSGRAAPAAPQLTRLADSCPCEYRRAVRGRIITDEGGQATEQPNRTDY